MIDPSEVINYRKKVSIHDNVKLNRIDQQKKQKKELEVTQLREEQIMQGEWLDHLNYFEETLLRLSQYFPKVSRLVSKFWLRELNEVIDSNNTLTKLKS